MIGVDYWNNGYATEAARRIVEFGFNGLELNRIGAKTLKRNTTSGRVLQKLGMKHEGTIRQGKMKWGKFEDLELYGILKSEWQPA